jgi:hypothetical protein
MLRKRIGSASGKLQKTNGSGFTLIASLLLMLLLSGLAIGLMLMVNTEGKVGGMDLQNNIAFHAAEGGMEKMTSDLAATFQNAQSPTASQICAVGSQPPTMVGVSWKQYSVQPASGCSGTLLANFGQISSGPDQGLYAQIIPINMLTTAALPGGQEATMTRQAQVALIPVFQFGVFSESDLAFFSGPNFDFGGRVHTNSDLYPEVGNGSFLTFHDKISVWGNVVRANLPNGFPTSANYAGTVQAPASSGGCDGSKPNCPTLTLTSGSVTGAGGNPPQSAQNTSWPTVSLTTFAGRVVDGDYGLSGCGTGGTAKCGTGAKKLSLPFVSGTTNPYEIIRRPPAGESQTSSLGESREYNMAQIRVLLTDDPAELPGGASDANNVRLANVPGTPGSNPYGIATSTPTGLPALGAGSTYNTYFAAASNAVPDETSCAGTYCPTVNTKSTIASDWPLGPATPAAGSQTLVPAGAPIVSGSAGNATPTISLCPPANVAAGNLPAGCSNVSAAYPYYVSTPTTTWNLIDGYLRVEYKDSTGNWNPVTMEWLQLGFARGTTPPTAPGTNPVNPNAILVLQQPADRSGNGTVDALGLAPSCTQVVLGVCTKWKNPLPPELLTDSLMPTPASPSTSPLFGVTSSATAAQSVSMFNWYPINFYDVREGEVRDTNTGDSSCTANGVMNAVEIDVGNLKQWLAGNIGTSGTNVDYVAQNGYILYFSDRRGMLTNPYKGRKTGDSGLEDVINASASAGTPDGVLEPPTAGTSSSPEDVNKNGYLDNYGGANIGLGFYNGTTNINGAIVAATPDNPYNPRITSCSSTGRKNWISGARHVLKLVDGSLGNVPLRTDAGAPNTGGFTVASENPVYVLGDYNSNSTDPTWSTTPTDATGHSAASVIADAVSVLSNSWNDLNSFTTPTSMASRVATNTYYRLAIAGGKNVNFPRPTWGASNDFGTDGGAHNFLRYLENWGGKTLNYKGSMVSMYYSTYDTGVFKCCTVVYSPPTRNYIFDSDFTLPSGLPPGTPLFRDVNTLGYRQMTTTRASGQ